MTGTSSVALGDRSLRLLAGLSIAALLLSTAVDRHLLCGLICIHGHSQTPPPSDICHGSASER